MDFLIVLALSEQRAKHIGDKNGAGFTLPLFFCRAPP